MFRALKAHHQEVVKIQALWYDICPHVWYMVSHQGVVLWVESEVDLNWTKVHRHEGKSKQRKKQLIVHNNMLFFSMDMFGNKLLGISSVLR